MPRKGRQKCNQSLGKSWPKKALVHLRLDLKPLPPKKNSNYFFIFFGLQSRIAGWAILSSCWLTFYRHFLLILQWVSAEQRNSLREELLHALLLRSQHHHQVIKSPETQNLTELKTTNGTALQQGGQRVNYHISHASHMLNERPSHMDHMRYYCGPCKVANIQNSAVYRFCVCRVW